MSDDHLIFSIRVQAKLRNDWAYCPFSCHVVELDVSLLDLGSWTIRPALCVWIKTEGAGPVIWKKLREFWVSVVFLGPSLPRGGETQRSSPFNSWSPTFMGKGEEDEFDKKSPLSNMDSKRYGPSNLICQFVNWVKPNMTL